MSTFMDITGNVYDRLTVIEKDTTRTTTRRVYWVCRCTCGQVCSVLGDNLRGHRQLSCGCLSREKASARATHRRIDTPEYRVWSDMLSRCTNPNVSNYHRYGGRGITVCDRWYTFANFFADMGERPSADYALDRVDNNGPYSLDNCRWATRQQNARNTRTNLLLTYNGETMPLCAWSEKLGINHGTLRQRIMKHGWSIERAFTEPVRRW